MDCGKWLKMRLLHGPFGTWGWGGQGVERDTEACHPFHPVLGCAAIGATATGEVSSLGGAEVEVEASAGAGRGDVSHAAGVQQMP